MKQEFIPEYQVYELLDQVGIKTPKWQFVEADFSRLAFQPGEAVVVKGMAEDLWHKSDCGALKFCEFDLAVIKKLDKEIQQNVKGQYTWLGTLITERVNIQKAAHAPSEIFVSLQRDKCCGAVISFGFGGLLTEEWAR